MWPDSVKVINVSNGQDRQRGWAAGSASPRRGGRRRGRRDGGRVRPGASTSARPGTTSISNDNATWDDGYRSAGGELKKITGYALRPLSNPSVTSYQQVVQMTLQTSKSSDLVKWASGYQLKRLARAGGLTDLTRVWERYAAKGWGADGPRATRSRTAARRSGSRCTSRTTCSSTASRCSRSWAWPSRGAGPSFCTAPRSSKRNGDHAVPGESVRWLAGDRVVPGTGQQGRSPLLPGVWWTATPPTPMLRHAGRWTSGTTSCARAG